MMSEEEEMDCKSDETGDDAAEENEILSSSILSIIDAAQARAQTERLLKYVKKKHPNSGMPSLFSEARDFFHVFVLFSPVCHQCRIL